MSLVSRKSNDKYTILSVYAKKNEIDYPFDDYFIHI